MICLPFMMGYGQTKVVDSLVGRLSVYPHKDTTKVKICYQLGNLLLRKDKKKALKYTQNGLSLSQELHNQNLETKGLILMGAIYSSSEQYVSALSYYQKALVLCEKSNDTKNLGNLYFNTATVYRHQEKYEKALEYNHKALLIAEKNKDDILSAKIYNNIGIVYDRKKVYVQAIFWYEKSISVKEKLKDSASLPLTLANLGLVYTYESPYENYAKANLYIQKALQIAQKREDYHTQVFTILYLAEYHLRKKNYEVANTYYEHVISFREKYNDDTHFLEALLGQSKIAQAKSQFVKAEELVKQALLEAKRLKNLEKIRDSYAELTKIYKAQHSYTLALEMAENQLIFKDSAFKKIKEQQMAILENDYEVFKIEQNNEQLRIENELQQEKLRKQGLTVALVVAGLTLTSVLVMLLIYINSKRQNYANLLQENNETITHINQELAKNNQIKDKLFSIISHDLRSPLASLKGLLMLLKEEEGMPPDFKEYLTQTSYNLDNTFILLDNLLKWSSSQMNALQPKLEPFELDILIEEIINLYEPIAQQKNIQLESKSLSKQRVFADRDMIHLVLRNLINNAIKFTPQQGKVSIEMKIANPKTVEISVSDTGVGISTENLPKVFGELSTRGTNAEKGTGLGLQLCKEFITLNQGTISIKSEVGKGSTFSFTIPTLTS